LIAALVKDQNAPTQAIPPDLLAYRQISVVSSYEAFQFMGKGLSRKIRSPEEDEVAEIEFGIFPAAI
jgi:hypothetical protein